MDTFKIFLVGLTLALLIVSPVLAQDDDDEVVWVEYESEFGLVTLSVPEGWFVEEIGSVDEPLWQASLGFSNDESLFDSDEIGAPPGYKGGAIVAFPLEMMMAIESRIEADISPEQLVETMVELTIAQDEYYELGETDVIQMDDHPPNGVIPFTLEIDDIEGLYFAMLRDDVLLYGAFEAYIGEFEDEYRDLAIKILLTYEVKVNGEELFEIMTGQ
jgi:hypothetical protein